MRHLQSVVLDIAGGNILVVLLVLSWRTVDLFVEQRQTNSFTESDRFLIERQRQRARETPVLSDQLAAAH